MSLEMTDDRYSRQLPLIGTHGQEHLFQSSVFIAGTGGLGSPVATYLTLAGIGNLILADDDVVQESNLNRQFLHATHDVGVQKVYSAARTLSALNPDPTITACPERVTGGNVDRFVQDADIIVDATDNFETRYLLNDAAIRHQVPLIHGAVEGFSGQLTTIIPGKTPCLSCVFPLAPPKRQTPIIGATAGVIGSLEAIEVIKYLTGNGNLMTGRLLIWDGLSGRTDYLMISRRDNCSSCNPENDAL